MPMGREVVLLRLRRPSSRTRANCQAIMRRPRQHTNHSSTYFFLGLNALTSRLLSLIPRCPQLEIKQDVPSRSLLIDLLQEEVSEDANKIRCKNAGEQPSLCQRAAGRRYSEAACSRERVRGYPLLIRARLTVLL
jgi:hypothetical protein